MMTWLYYLLEANLYLAIFYGFYRLFLHRETFYTLNRYYLLSATILAFILPMLQMGYLYSLIGLSNRPAYTENPNTGINTQQGLGFNTLIMYAYIGVAAVFLGRFIVNLYHILVRAVHNVKLRKDNIIYVELPGPEPAFSFFNLLFINPGASNKSTIIKHEMVHIRQKHSADIVFFEMIQVLNWFNPIAYLLKKEAKLLHEYIADDLTTNTIQKHQYAMFLIQNSFGVGPNQLTNQIFNQSILKMRINMLNKEKSAGWARLRFLLALPLVGGMLCASTMAFTKDYATVDLYQQKDKYVGTTNQDTSKKAKPATKKRADHYSIDKKQEKIEVMIKGKVTGKPIPPPPPPAPPKEKKSTKISEVRRIKLHAPIIKSNKNSETPPPPPVEVREVIIK